MNVKKCLKVVALLIEDQQKNLTFPTHAAEYILDRNPLILIETAIDLLKKDDSKYTGFILGILTGIALAEGESKDPRFIDHLVSNISQEEKNASYH